MVCLSGCVDKQTSETTTKTSAQSPIPSATANPTFIQPSTTPTLNTNTPNVDKEAELRKAKRIFAQQQLDDAILSVQRAQSRLDRDRREAQYAEASLEACIKNSNGDCYSQISYQSTVEQMLQADETVLQDYESLESLWRNNLNALT